MPTSNASSAAANDNSSVAGSLSLISMATLRPWRSERPKSPWTALAAKRKNWTITGWSRPNSLRSLRLFFRRRILPDHRHDGVTDEIEQAERDQRHYRHDGDGLQDSSEDEGEQRRRSRCGRPGCRAGRNALGGSIMHKRRRSVKPRGPTRRLASLQPAALQCRRACSGAPAAAQFVVVRGREAPRRGLFPSRSATSARSRGVRYSLMSTP